LLIGISLFVAVFLPFYSRLSNKLEEKVNWLFAIVSIGRVSRFVSQFAFNFAVFNIFIYSRVLSPSNIDDLGGVLGVTIVTTLASQGAQYVAIVLSNRNVGDLNRNVLVGLSINVLVAALATAGIGFVKPIFLSLGIVLGAAVFSIGVLSDIRSAVFPRRGIGIFFGTFNPFHKTHLRIVETALRERGLYKVVVHPTIIPKLHARAIERGEIRIARVQNGLQVYERTDKADANVNYFPTGDRFYPPETRRLMIELAIAEAGLGGKVEVAFFPEIYRDYGFHGVIRKIKRQYPGQPIHCLHGSDLGGMLIRNICDESGWMYPMAVRRRDGVSGTAIRNGAITMTSAIVAETLVHLKAGTAFFVLRDRRYRNDSGVLLAA